MQETKELVVKVLIEILEPDGESVIEAKLGLTPDEMIFCKKLNDYGWFSPTNFAEAREEVNHLEANYRHGWRHQA